jgi:hypothetical protein
MSNEGMDRRTFITVSSAAIAGLAISPLYGQTGQADIVSVGFQPFVSRRRAVGVAKDNVALYDALSVSTTEPSLMRTGARFSIHGEATRQPMTLDVLHNADNSDEKVVFYAWGSRSNALSFNVPVELTRTVDIAVTIAKNRQVFPFTVGSVEGALKLNSGKYIFAVDRSPSWSRLFIDQGVLKTVDGNPVGFDYAIVSVAARS